MQVIGDFTLETMEVRRKKNVNPVGKYSSKVEGKLKHFQ